jgi:hypothetical protein
MNSPDPRRLQVTLTGTRLGACGDEELHARLKATFRVSDAQAAAMLKGRCVVKRGLEAPSARKLVEMLREVGLQAVVEEIRRRLRRRHRARRRYRAPRRHRAR